MIFLLALMVALTTSFIQNNFDFDELMSRPQNIQRQRLFSLHFDEILRAEKCVSNNQLFSKFENILENHSLSFQNQFSVLQQKLFYDRVLSQKQYERKWDNWDSSVEEYQFCRTESADDIRRPPQTINFTNHTVSIRGTFDLYPYLYHQVRSSSITYLLSLLPDDLKEQLSMARYVVYGSKIYQRIYSRQHKEINFVQKLQALGFDLPDIDFVVYLGDNIKEKTIHNYCSSKNYNVSMHDTKFELYRKVIIELPAFMWAKDLKNSMQFNKLLTIDNLINNPEWEKTYLEVIEETRRIDWESKIDKAYFRGSPSGQSQGFVDVTKNLKINNPRLELFNMSKKNPDIIDAKPFLSETNITLNILEEMSIQAVHTKVSKSQQMKAKYLISMDGESAPYQHLPWTLLSKSVVLKQQSSKIQWFFDHLKPYQHYIPINSDLSDLKEMINLLRDKDELAKEIAQTGNRHAIDRFSQKRLFKDFLRIFKDYTSIQKIQESPPDVEALVKSGLLKYVTTQKERTHNIQFLPSPSLSFVEHLRQNVWSILQTLAFMGCIGLMIFFRYSKNCVSMSGEMEHSKIAKTIV